MISKKYVIIVIFILFLFTKSKAESGVVSGTFSGVSTYVFRGIKVYDGVALQGSFDTVYNILAFGVWYSTVDFGKNGPRLEIDPYLSINFNFSHFLFSTGLTNYMYDTSVLSNDSSYEYELFAKIVFKDFKIASYYVPNQPATQIYISKSYYWLEIAYEREFFNMIWSAQLAYGSYPLRFSKAFNKSATGQILFTGVKPLNDFIALNWNYSHSIDLYSSDYFWFGLVFNY